VANRAIAAARRALASNVPSVTTRVEMQLRLARLCGSDALAADGGGKHTRELLAGPAA
jgi:hypothetical protein